MMKNKFKQFFLRLVIFTIVLAIPALVLWLLLPAGKIPGILPWLYLLFFTITALTHYILLRITRLSPMRFVSYYMLSTLLRLTIYVIAVILYAFLNRENLFPFVLSFFLLYIFYTIFEVVSFISQSKT